MYRDGLFFLCATIDVPEAPLVQPTRLLGVDLGIVNIAVDSDGHKYSGEPIERVRQRCTTHRRTYQATRTKSAKRRLKRLAGKQARFQRWVNHTVAKHLVAYAKDTKAALVLEELTGIRRRMTVRKAQRNKQHNWSFRQLRDFLSYKAQRAGVSLLFVDPWSTSSTCHHCGYSDKKNRRSQADFSCLRCGFACHADLNAARNLATRGAVTRPDLIAPCGTSYVVAW